MILRFIHPGPGLVNLSYWPSRHLTFIPDTLPPTNLEVHNPLSQTKNKNGETKKDSSSLSTEICALTHVRAFFLFFPFFFSDPMRTSTPAWPGEMRAALVAYATHSA